ncbi:hypothetical protein GGI19_007011, partial [Coemansia pectinata]
GRSRKISVNFVLACNGNGGHKPPLFPIFHKNDRKFVAHALGDDSVFNISDFGRLTSELFITW